MKKIIFLFFIIFNFLFAEYEDIYKVKVEREISNNVDTIFYSMETLKNNSPCEYGIFIFPSIEESKKAFENIPKLYSEKTDILDIYEHEISKNSGVFSFKSIDILNDNFFSYSNIIWKNNEIRILFFSNKDEVKKFFKYLEVNKFFSSNVEKLYISRLINSANFDI